MEKNPKKIAIPPRRGMGRVWIFLSLKGLSTTLRLNAIFLISRVKVKVKVKVIIKRMM